MLHVRCNHPLSVIIALHYGTVKAVLKVGYFLLRGGSSFLIWDLTLLGTMLKLLLAAIFASSTVSHCTWG
jgi:hypothetical protein